MEEYLPLLQGGSLLLRTLYLSRSTHTLLYLDKEEFIKLVYNKGLVLSQQEQNTFRQYFQVVAYAEDYRWCPPPLFTFCMALLQVILYILHLHFNEGQFKPLCSTLIYRLPGICSLEDNCFIEDNCPQQREICPLW